MLLMGVTLVMKHVVNYCQRRLREMLYVCIRYLFHTKRHFSYQLYNTKKTVIWRAMQVTKLLAKTRLAYNVTVEKSHTAVKIFYH